MQNPQTHNTLSQAMGILLDKRLPFAAYRLPGTARINLLIQSSPEISPLKNLRQGISGKGFLISSFSGEDNRNYLIRPDILLDDNMLPEQLAGIRALPRNTVADAASPSPETTDRKDYLSLIREAVDQIREGEFEKVVLSRVMSVEGDYLKRLPKVFRMLCDTYPDVFVYLFLVNGQCWMGATPEPFVCSNENDLYTVSLAGTRSLGDAGLQEDQWMEKEMFEQEYVTRHIEKTLNAFSVKHYKKKGPYTASAGNLLHLRTDFIFPGCFSEQSLCALIKALHPTPAVCGMSPGKALDFIRSKENHDREYYTGFLGPVGFEEQLQLYVNLRCMKVLEQRLVLFIGGGITKESDPEAEWKETELKAGTLLSVIQKI